MLADIARFFGEDLILPDGTLDRRRLAGRAFASAEKTELLNSVTHPAITALARKRVAEAEKNGYEIAMLDAPVLFRASFSAIAAPSYASAHREISAWQGC